MKFIGSCFKERVIMLVWIAASSFMISFETLTLYDSKYVKA